MQVVGNFLDATCFSHFFFTRIGGQEKAPEGTFEGPLRISLANESANIDFSCSAPK